MNKSHDLKKMTVALKRDEQMVAFAGFQFRPHADQPPKEGILKLSLSGQAKRSKYITLTFIADTDEDEETMYYLRKLFNELQEDSIRAYMGNTLHAMIQVPLDTFMKSSNFFIQELDLYLNLAVEPSLGFVEDKLFVGIREILPFNFGSVEWFQPQQPE